MKLKTGESLLLGFLLAILTLTNAWGKEDFSDIYKDALGLGPTAILKVANKKLDKKVSFSDVYQDALEKLWPTAILELADKKLDERVFYNPEYRYFAGREMIRNFWFSYEPSPNFRFDTRTERVMANLVKEDIPGALEYALERQARVLELYLFFKKWGKGLSTFRIDKKSSSDSFEVETPSYNRELDPYEEAKSNLRFECGNIKGDASIMFAKRLRCSEATNAIAIRESEIFTIRAKPGIDADIQTTNSYGITPVVRPYFNLKYKAYEIELSYIYPFRLVDNVSSKASFIPDIRDRIFYKREAAERIQLEIDKTFTKNFVVSGNYRYERLVGVNSIGIAPKLYLFPYIASAGADINPNTMKSLFTVDAGRVLGGYVLGIRGTATDREKQIFFTISKVWTDPWAHPEKSDAPYPYETSFFEDIRGVFRSLF